MFGNIALKAAASYDHAGRQQPQGSGGPAGATCLSPWQVMGAISLRKAVEQLFIPAQDISIAFYIIQGGNRSCDEYIPAEMEVKQFGPVVKTWNGLVDHDVMLAILNHDSSAIDQVQDFDHGCSVVPHAEEADVPVSDSHGDVHYAATDTDVHEDTLGHDSDNEWQQHIETAMAYFEQEVGFLGEPLQVASIQ